VKPVTTSEKVIVTGTLAKLVGKLTAEVIFTVGFV